MVTFIGVASGIGIAFVASRLPGWWFLIPVKFLLWIGGMILVGNAIVRWLLSRGDITLVQ
ncbi:MAG: hypothetical protein CL755_12690 [Chloroflexi bacterium]|nr:hypothetical protein [Chloroflexota bacterium]